MCDGGEGETPPPGGALARCSSGGLRAQGAAVPRWAVLFGGPRPGWGGNLKEKAPCSPGSRRRPPRVRERQLEVPGDTHSPGSRQPGLQEVGAGPGRSVRVGRLLWVQLWVS